MDSFTLLHGSEQIVEVPDIAFGNDRNDYGRGFYCTREEEMAKEWACKNGSDGFVNRYILDVDGLKTLDLCDGRHTVLNWIAILLKNRTFSLNYPIAVNAREYIIEHYAVDTSDFDLITGYRADDSYFRYAESFVENTLPLRSLNRALQLGKLGLQTVLVSPKAFGQIRFVDATPVDKNIYYPKFVARDTSARLTYREEIAKSRSYVDDIFVLDILREEMKNDDPRIQRILLE
jgi:hypothetical protein